MIDRDERTDAELVEATLAGDADAYGGIVRRYQDELYRHAVQMVGEGDAADLVQEAFLRGYRRLDDCRDPGSVGGWLFRIVSSICKDHLRTPHEKRHALSLDDETAPALSDGAGDTGAEAGRAFLRDDLEEALDALTPEKREAFLLKHLEEYSYREMSELLGESVPALKMRVHRAREELRERLSEYREETPSTGRRPGSVPGAILAPAV